MIELGIGADIVRGVVLIYWLVCLGFAALALWLGTSGPRKVVYALLVVLLFVAPGLPNLYRNLDYRHKYAKAKTLFDERCKAADATIYRTVENVEGVLLLNVRPDDKAASRADPRWADAGLPDEAGGQHYVRTFLQWEHRQFANQRGYVNDEATDSSSYGVSPGFSFVDVQERDGAVYRYRLGASVTEALSRAPIAGNPARYAVSFTNDANPDDRKYWIAGTTVTITDMTDNAVVAKSTWYALEPGQGERGGGRAPWGFAQRCPAWSSPLGAQTRMFVDQVLKPSGRNE